MTDTDDGQILAAIANIDQATENLRAQAEKLADDRAMFVRGLFDRARERRIAVTGIDHGAKRDVADLLGVSIPTVSRALDRAQAVITAGTWGK